MTQRMDDPSFIGCGNCPHYGMVDQEVGLEDIVMGCTNRENPWQGMRRERSEGILCPDHPRHRQFRLLPKGPVK